MILAGSLLCILWLSRREHQCEKRPSSKARTIIIIKGKHKQDPKPDAEPPGKQSRDIHPEKESAWKCFVIAQICGKFSFRHQANWRQIASDRLSDEWHLLQNITFIERTICDANRYYYTGLPWPKFIVLFNLVHEKVKALKYWKFTQSFHRK